MLTLGGTWIVPLRRPTTQIQAFIFVHVFVNDEVVQKQDYPEEEDCGTCVNC